MISTKITRYIRILGLTSAVLSTSAQALDAAVGVKTDTQGVVAQIVTAANSNATVLAPTWVLVKPDQTLWRIAVNNAPDKTHQWQMLMSLYNINPSAFRGGDIRVLLANSKLRLPTPTQLNALSIKQAKAAYDVLVEGQANLSKVQTETTKAITTKAVATKVPVAKSDEQRLQSAKLQQQVTDQQDALNSLASQSEALTAQVDDLKTQQATAFSQQELLVNAGETLAQGVVSQEQGLKALNDKRSKIEADMQVLGEVFESTREQLTQAQQDLYQAEQTLSVTQDNLQLAQQAKLLADATAQVNPPQDVLQTKKAENWLKTAQIAALVLLFILLVFGVLWWMRSRDRKVAAGNKTKSQMAQRRARRTFIDDTLDTPSNNAHDDLSIEVDAMLTGQRPMHNQADEPVEYLSPEEDLDTKLLLAVSYRDMGEVQTALAMLQEVSTKGNADQQDQAALILSTINQE